MVLFLPQERVEEQIQGLMSFTNQHIRQRRWRIRGHSQLQGKHEAFEEVFRQLWDLFGEDLTDEGDELVVLVAQRGELGSKARIKPHRRGWNKPDRRGWRFSPSAGPAS